MDNFKVSIILPGSPEDKKIQTEIEMQKQAEKERLMKLAENFKRQREAERKANSEALARRVAEIAEAEKKMQEERQQQNDNQRRITAGELKPLEIDGHPIHRVDFIQLPDGTVRVSKINHDENRQQDFVVSVEIKPVDLSASREWLTAHGYIVRQWPGGMRAWFGRLWPIRTRSEIIAMRSRATKSAERGTSAVDAATVDFAYDM